MKNTRNARRVHRRVIVTAAILAGLTGLVLSATEPKDQNRQRGVKLVPVKTRLPTAQFDGTPQDIRAPRIKPVQTKPYPPFLAPSGTKNVALGKPVSSSDPEPVIGDLAMVTDGDKEAGEGSFVELGPLLQHVMIDLQAQHEIYGIRLWHYHQLPRVYFDVIVQASNDPNFTANVETIFNNDMDNSAGLGLGKGKAMHFVDTHFGELIDARAARARYVRLYSNGNTTDDLNHYIEVEVYGRPASEVPGLIPLRIEYPKAMFIGLGRWKDVPYTEGFPMKPPEPLMVPEGTKNVALGKPVSASNPSLVIGTLNMITDGSKDAGEGHYAELYPGLQHITIDLQGSHEIYAIAVWHWYWVPRVYFDVIIQTASDPNFAADVETVFNNDMDDSSGLGLGKGKALHYVETHLGKVIAVNGMRARYVRLYSNGNSMNEFNHYTELEVYGQPVEETDGPAAHTVIMQGNSVD